MKPFSMLIAERAKDPERAAREAFSRLERWQTLSGSKQVSLDDVAWFGAVFLLAGIEAKKMVANETNADGSRVVTKVATDFGATSDSAGG